MPRAPGLIVFVSTHDIFWSDKYAKDITKEVFDSVQAEVTQITNNSTGTRRVIPQTTIERRVTEVVTKLNEFMSHLHRLVEKAGDEDWHIGDVHLKRWKKRVITYLNEEVQEKEVSNFDQIEFKGSIERGARSYLFEAFRPLNGALEALAERIEDDPLAVLQIGSTETDAVADREEVAINFDVFLSYASPYQLEADQIFEAIESAGGKAFVAAKSLNPGDDFADEIRNALWSSREVWLLVSPNSLKSDLVISEWGAAWALRKRIVPILFRCSPSETPDRIRRLHCIDFHRFPELIKNRFSGEAPDKNRISTPNSSKPKDQRKRHVEPVIKVEGQPTCPNCSTESRPFRLSPIPSDFIEIENATHECSKCNFKTRI